MPTTSPDPERSRSILSIYLSEIGGPASPDDPITANLAFVVRVARRYAGLGLPLEDLISEGNVGLLEAARRFDPARGTRFITYAVWWIRKAILNALTSQSTTVRLPYTQRQSIRNVLDAERRLANDLGRDADRDEVALHLRTSVARIDRLLQMRMKDLSVDQTVGERSDIPLHDQLPDRRDAGPEAALIRAEERARLRAALGALDERERRILADRLGLRRGRVVSLRELGAELGMSREAIRLIENRAKQTLRKIVARRPRSVRRAARAPRIG